MREHLPSSVVCVKRTHFPPPFPLPFPPTGEPPLWRGLSHSLARSLSLSLTLLQLTASTRHLLVSFHFISFHFVSTRFTVKEIEQHLRHRRRRNFISKSQIVLQSTFVRLVKPPQFGNTKLSDILTRADKLRIPLKKERNISTRCVSTVL